MPMTLFVGNKLDCYETKKYVERVDTFKYLCVVLDNESAWKQNAVSIVKKTKS